MESSISPTLRLQPNPILPPYDPQRNIRKSMLNTRVYHLYHLDRTVTHRAYPPLLYQPAEKKTELGEQLATPSQVLILPEVLSEIFAYFHMDDGFIELPINQRDFPWNVAGVCSQWRRVVWNLPGGFRTIAIGAPQGPHLTYKHIQAMQDSLLHALSLSTALVGIVTYPPLVYFPIPYSHRIKELRLNSIDQAILASLFQVPPGSFDHLEELDLRLRFDDGWIVFPEWSTQVMPVLQALYIDSNQAYSPRHALFLPWEQLTELEVTDALSADNILHILRHLRHIVRGKFRMIERAVSLHLPFTLPHLTFLELSHEHRVDAANFLGPLSLPSLEEVVIIDDELSESQNVRGVWSHQPYTALIKRSHCAIRRFILTGSRIATLTFLEDSIEPFLQVLPYVRVLKLDALVPPSTFMMLQQNRLLSQLESAAWRMDTARIDEYIDWLLSFEVGGDHALRNVTAFCHTGRRFVAAEKRFIARKAEISCRGINAQLFRCDCHEGLHSDSEGSEGSSDEESDEG